MDGRESDTAIVLMKSVKAGVMDYGIYSDTGEGTPQGNGASPVLANVFLHYVLDNWFDVVVRRYSHSECYMVRYADDFVCCFQYQNDAEWFENALRTRFAKYGLTLAKEKTKALKFGRYAARKRAERGLGKPETFDFLGFTFFCSMNTERTFYRCMVKTSRKKLRSKIKVMKEWIKMHRNMPLEKLFKKLNEKLKGHYQYYAVADNIIDVKRYLRLTTWYLYKYLNRRSQKRSYNHETFYNGLLRTFALAQPRIRVSLYYR